MVTVFTHLTSTVVVCYTSSRDKHLQRERGTVMHEVFYIVETSDGWFQLRILPSHSVVSCGGNFNHLLEVLNDYVVRYKTPQGVYKAIGKTYNKGFVPPLLLETREKEYEIWKDTFRDEIYDVVFIAEKKVKEGRQTLLKRKSPLIDIGIRVMKEEDLELEMEEEQVTVIRHSPKPVLIKRVIL